MFVEQIRCGSAWRGTAGADTDQVSDFGEGEPNRLPGLNELDSDDCRLVVVAIAILSPRRFGKQ
jgi:hypothetical protein